MARTQEQRRADTRARLIAAAADLFARQGFHATSAEAVAAAADRTTGALYDHFGGKEGLLFALLEVWMEQTVADLRPALEEVPELDDRLRALWSGIVRHDEGNADAWVLLEFELWLHSVRDPQIGGAVAARFAHAREGLGEGLERWAHDFGFTLPGPTEEVSAQVIALLLGAAFQYRLDPSAAPERTVVAGLRRLLGLDATAALATAADAAGRRDRP
ncbi:MAG: putative transcriptional regulator, TetR family [Acidimicrobiales bacterium]|nr:putative transcriptional regulator, TetR family [Acidimicrobiales bacterium]